MKRTISISLDDEQIAAVDEIARAERRDRSAQIAVFIDQAFRRINDRHQAFIPECGPHVLQHRQEGDA